MLSDYKQFGTDAPRDVSATEVNVMMDCLIDASYFSENLSHLSFLVNSDATSQQKSSAIKSYNVVVIFIIAGQT